MEQFSGELGVFVSKALLGSGKDVDFIMSKLTTRSKLSTTRYVDYALSLVESVKGKKRILHYLYHGSLIQRNYASLYFNRLGEWQFVKDAFERGLIDEIQAYAR